MTTTVEQYQNALDQMNAFGSAFIAGLENESRNENVGTFRRFTKTEQDRRGLLSALVSHPFAMVIVTDYEVIAMVIPGEKSGTVNWSPFLSKASFSCLCAKDARNLSGEWAKAQVEKSHKFWPEARCEIWSCDALSEYQKDFSRIYDEHLAPLLPKKV